MTDFNQEAPMDSYPVRITAAHARLARKFGDGNLSLGIRDMIECLDSLGVEFCRKQLNTEKAKKNKF